MNEEEGMGEIDGEGFFVWKKGRGEEKDAWLDSLGVGNEEGVVREVRKRVVEGEKEGKVGKRRVTDQGVK